GGGTAVDSQWTTCLRTEQISESIEGNEAAEKVSRTTWEYDPNTPYYNVSRVIEWGEWNLATATNVPGDERVTEDFYASPGGRSIVSRVMFVTVKDLAGKVSSKRLFCYASCAAAGNGLITQVREYLTDTTQGITDVAKITASILYDSWGNPIQTTGAV